MYLSSTFLNPDSTLGTVDSRGPFYPLLAEQLSLVVPSSEAAKCYSDAETVLLKQTKYEVFFNPSLAVHSMVSLDIVKGHITQSIFLRPSIDHYAFCICHCFGLHDNKVSIVF